VIEMSIENLKEKFNKAIYYSTPFPHFVIPGFMNSEESILAIEAIRSLDDFDDIVMGGRGRITKGGTDSKFKRLLDNSKTLFKLYSLLNNKVAFDFLIKIFESKMNSSGLPYYSCLNFLSSRFDMSKGSYDDTASVRQLTQVRKSVATRLLNRIKNELQKLKRVVFPRVIFFDCDFSMSKCGYSREPHHDSAHRIINFVLYFNSIPSEMGGSLEVFEFINNDRSVLQRQPAREALHLVKEIQPVEGTLVIFLSTPLSIHGVSMLKGDSTQRFFSYGSYSLSKDVNWKLTSTK